MTGPVYRLVVTIITAVVAYINSTAGTNLPANGVVTAVLGLVGLGLVLADAHAENGKGQNPADLVQQIVDALPSILAGMQQKATGTTDTTETKTGGS
jgi:ribosomal protein S5